MKPIVIDAHTHLSSIALPEDRIQEPKQGYTGLLLEMMDEAGIDKAVVMPIAPWDTNEMIVEGCRLHPDRLVGFASVDPNKATIFDWDLPLHQLAEAIEGHGLRGIKLNPRVQNFSLRDPRIIPLFDYAAHQDIPVLIDGLTPVSPIMLEANLPLAVDTLIRAVPKVKIILAHMGGHRVLDAYSLALTHRHVYLDMSAIIYLFEGSSVEQDMKFAIRKLAPSGQIIFGSDYPMHDARKTIMKIKQARETCLAIFAGIGLPETEVQGIMGDTMAKLLHLG